MRVKVEVKVEVRDVCHSPLTRLALFVDRLTHLAGDRLALRVDRDVQLPEALHRFALH